MRACLPGLCAALLVLAGGCRGLHGTNDYFPGPTPAEERTITDTNLFHSPIPAPPPPPRITPKARAEVVATRPPARIVGLLYAKGSESRLLIWQHSLDLGTTWTPVPGAWLRYGVGGQETVLSTNQSELFRAVDFK